MSVIFDTKPQFFSSSANEKQPLASKMAQELKEPATKPDARKQHKERKPILASGPLTSTCASWNAYPFNPLPPHKINMENRKGNL